MRFVNNCDGSVCFRKKGWPSVFPSKKKWRPQEMTKDVQNMKQEERDDMKNVAKNWSI
jgi:hypothetical protein